MSTEETKTTLQSALDNYNNERDHYKMVEGEFKTSKSKVDDIIESAKTELLTLLPDARDMAEALMRGAQSEAIRWQVTKFILEFGLKGGEGEDDLVRMLNSFKKSTDQTTSPSEK